MRALFLVGTALVLSCQLAQPLGHALLWAVKLRCFLLSQSCSVGQAAGLMEEEKSSKRAGRWIGALFVLEKVLEFSP